MKKRRRKISIWWLWQTRGWSPVDTEHARFVLSAKRKNGGYFRKTGWPGGVETYWRYYPLKPIEHPGFYFVGYL